MPAPKANKELVQADMILTSSDLSAKAMKLLKQGKVTVDQYQAIISTSNLFVNLYINWDKQPEQPKSK